MLFEIFIYFKVKLSFHTVSGRSVCFQFLFWFSSPILLSEMKSPVNKNLLSTSNFSFKFCIIFQCNQTYPNSSILFLAQTLYSLVKSSRLRCRFLRLSSAQVEFVKFLMSILNWQINSSSNFVSFFIVMTQNYPVNFKLIQFLLWIKGCHQGPNFETFKCSGENLPNSSCHFWKHKSVFLQTLYQSWVPSNTTSLFFLSSDIKYFGQKQPIKVQIF